MGRVACRLGDCSGALEREYLEGRRALALPGMQRDAMHMVYEVLNSPAGGWVYVAVPTDLARETIAFVARKLANESTGDPDRSEAWTAADMRRFYWSNDEATRKLLDYLAGRDDPEVEIPAGDVAEELNMSPKAIGGLLGPLNRKTRDDFGREPLVRSSVRSVTRDGGRFLRRSLSMPGDVAGHVLAAAERPPVTIRKKARTPPEGTSTTKKIVRRATTAKRVAPRKSS